MISRLFACALMLLAAAPARAADANGYTAQYECRAGGPNCNVDVVGLTAQACQQTITAATTPTGDWSAINWSNNVICIQAGDHTGRGTLTLTSSGTAGTRKVLRYTRAGDNDDEPWVQSAGNRAKVRRINSNRQSYWIIHRLTMDGGSDIGAIVQGQPLIYNDFATNIIINRTYFTRLTCAGVCGGVKEHFGSYNTTQNSYFEDFPPHRDSEAAALYVEGASYFRFVNNEVRNASTGMVINQSGSLGQSVVENNDIYFTIAWFTNCYGAYDGSGKCMAAKGSVGFKGGGDSSNYAIQTHNRVWNVRVTDHSVCCTSTGMGQAFSWSTNAPADPSAQGDWILTQNNIVMDSQYCVQTTRPDTNNNSMIGNICYNIQDFNKSSGAANPGGKSGAFAMSYGDSHEYYLNTIISSKYWLIGGAFNGDYKCNVIIDGGTRTGSPGTGTVFNSNAYYGTVSSGLGETDKIDNSLDTRTHSTADGLGRSFRTTSAPPADGTAGDFLYKVTIAGTSAGSPPAYCATLGCTTTDGSMTVRAIRGPYSFKRKLRTVAGGETVIIPYAKAHSSAPENNFCPGIAGTF